MEGRWALVLSAALALAATGCASKPARFYTLESTATGSDGPPVHYAVVVGPVSIPASVDRPEMVVQLAPNQVRVDEFNRWAAPLNDAIARAVAGNLLTLLGTPDVATAPSANLPTAYRVTLDVQRFESGPGQTVLVDAIWAVSKPAGGRARSGRTSSREAAQGDGFDALAAAHSRALAQVSNDIATAVRAVASTKP